MTDGANRSVTGRHYRTGKAIRVICRGGRIAEIETLADVEQSAELPLVGPGLVDLQVNGMSGYDFNGEEARACSTEQITAALWREGVTSYCPTVITNEPTLIERSLGLIGTAASRSGLVADSIAGIHLEGPYISGQPGAKGAHPAEYVQPPDWEQFAQWNASSGDRIRIVTLAPEWEGSVDFIHACRDAGITVSLGHTAAEPVALEAAAAAGATMATHFGNGIAPMLPRHPNALWTQLADDRLACCVIADGHHVPDALLHVVYRVKGAAMILVSDAVQLCGMAPGEYRMPVGGEVVLTEQGRLQLRADGRLLAGAAAPLIHGLNHIVHRGIAELGDAWDMASVNAARQLDLPQSNGLVPGAPADLALLMNQNGRYRVQETIKSGISVYEGA